MPRRFLTHLVLLDACGKIYSTRYHQQNAIKMYQGPKNFSKSRFKLLKCGKDMHGMFLKWRNTIKSLSNIWQYFSCLIDEGISKICKKLNSHDGFLSYLQNSTANSAHLAAHFCPILAALKKPPWEFNFFHIFGIPSSSRHEKYCQIFQTLFLGISIL